MSTRIKRTAYEPPISMNLSQLSVEGQTTPMGVCRNGGVPYTVCQVGTEVNNVGTCTLGSAVGACSVGEYVTEDPKCIFGSNALVGCKSGSIA